MMESYSIKVTPENNWFTFTNTTLPLSCITYNKPCCVCKKLYQDLSKKGICTSCSKLTTLRQLYMFLQNSEDNDTLRTFKFPYNNK